MTAARWFAVVLFLGLLACGVKSDLKLPNKPPEAEASEPSLEEPSSAEPLAPPGAEPSS